MFLIILLGTGVIDLGTLNLPVLINSPHGLIPSLVFEIHSRADTFDSDNDIILKNKRHNYIILLVVKGTETDNLKNI